MRPGQDSQKQKMGNDAFVGMVLYTNAHEYQEVAVLHACARLQVRRNSQDLQSAPPKLVNYRQDSYIVSHLIR